MAQQPRFTATGSAAIWHGAVTRCTATAVVRPPRPAGPMPVALMVSSISCSKSADRAAGAGEQIVRRSAFLAMAATLSKVPPTATPTTSGGQAPVAFARTVSSTNRCTPSALDLGGLAGEALEQPGGVDFLQYDRRAGFFVDGHDGGLPGLRGEDADDEARAVGQAVHAQEFMRGAVVELNQTVGFCLRESHSKGRVNNPEIIY